MILCPGVVTWKGFSKHLSQHFSRSRCFQYCSGEQTGSSVLQCAFFIFPRHLILFYQMTLTAAEQSVIGGGVAYG